MATPQNPIDRRPFRSKADHELQYALESHYRGVAIPEVVAILESRKAMSEDRRAVRG